MSFFKRAATVLVAAAAVTTALTAALALPALAHVTIDPGTAVAGGFTKVAFRVPNERDDAKTTEVEVTFPTDHPLAFVSVKPVPGWTVKVNEGKLPKPVTTEHGELTEAVTSIVWSGGEIGRGEFQEFEVSMGRLPTGVGQLVFPAKQTYSSGEVVSWADAQAAGGAEPEHPAPVLKLTPAADADAGAATASASPAAVAATAEAAPAGSSDGTARLLGGAGLAVGVIGVVVAALALRRRPS